MIKYHLGISGQILLLNEKTIAHFKKHQQKRFYQREAGGQLFASYDSGNIIIEVVTGPRKTDKRSKYSYVPDRNAEQEEISLMHSKGLHYIGDWHTHPEPSPRPSDCDHKNIKECFAKSSHSLNGFLLIIVGQLELPSGLNVTLHNENSQITLNPSV